jgi:NADPH-dependent 2,4-dienoyl-CoA reductase/sulfur reductase-like enzyme
MTKKRVVVVGGVAGGATCAARLRRMDENAEIVVLDRGHYVSFANCGLPYYVGNVIHEESKLLLATPALFRERFNIEVRTRNEVTRIDRESRTIMVRDLVTGREYREHYDALVLSPGARQLVILAQHGGQSQGLQVMFEQDLWRISSRCAHSVASSVGGSTAGAQSKLM